MVVLTSATGPFIWPAAIAGDRAASRISARPKRQGQSSTQGRDVNSSRRCLDLCSFGFHRSNTACLPVPFCSNQDGRSCSTSAVGLLSFPCPRDRGAADVLLSAAALNCSNVSAANDRIRSASGIIAGRP